MAALDADWEEDTTPAAPAKEPARATAGDDWQEDSDWKEEAPTGKKSFMGMTYDPAKNDFKNKGVLSTLLNEFTKSPDPEAKATMETFAYPGGLVSDAGIEALKQLTGNGGLGKNEWVNALKGHATPATEQLKQAGYGPGVQYGVGLPYAALTDPMGSFMGPAAKEGAAAPTAMEALAQMRPGQGTVEAANQPVGSLVQKAAKAVYGAPFKKVDAELVSKFRNAGNTPKPFTNQLWNEGNPLVGGFSKSNPEIGEEISGLRKSTGQDIGDRIRQAGGDEEIHLAPNLKDNVHQEIMSSMPEPKMTPEQEEMLKLLPADQQDKARATIIAGAKADIAKATDPGDWLKSQLSSKDKDVRAQGIRILSDSAPELSKVIEDNAKHLANSGSKAGMLAFYNGLIDDLSEGPRSLEGLQDLKVSMQDAAARNQQMGANQYARNALPNKPKSAEMQAASELGKVIDGIVEDHLGESAASAADKAKYSALRRGEVPAWRVIQSHEARPALSKLDMLMGGGGAAAAMHYPGTVAGLAGAKVLDELRRSPRMATGTGMALNSAAKSNIWDNMLRRGLLNSSLQNQGGNQ